MQKETSPDPRQEALNNAVKFYSYVISNPRTGVNSPLARQLKQTIKLVFAKEGLQAALAVETTLKTMKGVTPSLVGVSSAEARKKAIEARKARRVSPDQDSAVDQAQARQTQAMQERLRRVSQREVLPQTSSPALDASEDVVADNTELAAKPLTATEVRGIATMGAKEIVDQFGADRILATLLAMEPDGEFTGSDRQLANRLKAKLK